MTKKVTKESKLTWVKLDPVAYGAIRQHGVLLSLIGVHAMQSGECFASVQTLASELNINRSLVLNSRKYLVEHGYIKKEDYFVKRCAVFTITEKGYSLLPTLYPTSPTHATSPTHETGTSPTHETSTSPTHATHKEKEREYKEEEGDKHPTTPYFSFEEWKEAYENQPYRFKYGDDTVESTYQKIVNSGFRYNSGKGKAIKDIHECLSHWVDTTRQKEILSQNLNCGCDYDLENEQYRVWEEVDPQKGLINLDEITDV